MYVLNKQFELLKFVLSPYMLTCSVMRFLSLYCWVCVVFVVVVPYVVGAVTVMHVLLFVVYAERMLGFDGVGIAGVGSGGIVMGGSCVLSSAGDVLEISVVRGGVCGICWGGGEWVTRLGLGFPNYGGTWGKWDMCFVCGGVGGWVAWSRVWEGGVVLCLCML